jgi:hypothetical protein
MKRDSATGSQPAPQACVSRRQVSDGAHAAQSMPPPPAELLAVPAAPAPPEAMLPPALPPAVPTDPAVPTMIELPPVPLGAAFTEACPPQQKQSHPRLESRNRLVTRLLAFADLTHNACQGRRPRQASPLAACAAPRRIVRDPIHGITYNSPVRQGQGRRPKPLSWLPHIRASRSRAVVMVKASKPLPSLSRMMNCCVAGTRLRRLVRGVEAAGSAKLKSVTRPTLIGEAGFAPDTPTT